MRPLFNEYKSTDESFIDPIITELWLNFREINLKFSQIISENKKTNEICEKWMKKLHKRSKNYKNRRKIKII